MEDYLRTLKTTADNLGQAGNSIPLLTLISQVLLGLDEIYNPVIVVIQRKSDISWLDMQSELLDTNINHDHDRGLPIFIIDRIQSFAIAYKFFKFFYYF